MRLIDADELEPDTDYDDGEYFAYSKAQIENAPTIEPERKTGKSDNDHIWNELSKVYNMDTVPDEAKSIIGDVMLGLGGTKEAE